jgi:hypothetical protein
VDAADARGVGLRPEIIAARASDEAPKAEAVGLSPSILTESSEQVAKGSASELAPDIVESEES